MNQFTINGKKPFPKKQCAADKPKRLSIKDIKTKTNKAHREKQGPVKFRVESFQRHRKKLEDRKKFLEENGPQYVPSVPEITEAKNKVISDQARKRHKPAYPKTHVGFPGGVRQVLQERQRRHDEMVSRGMRHNGTTIKTILDKKIVRFYSRGKTVEETDTFYTTKTDLCCMWCTEKFESVPIPIARKYDKINRVFHVGGQYCSVSCALAECRAEKSMSLLSIESATRLLFCKMFGSNAITDCTCAPPRRLLQKFGGPMTIEEFRATGPMGITTRELSLPIIPYTSGVEEIEHRKITISDQYNENGNQTLEEFVVSNMSLQHLGRRTNPDITENHQDALVVRVHKQHGRKPSIKEQLDISTKRLQIQRDTIYKSERKPKRKTRDLMDFLQRKEKKT